MWFFLGLATGFYLSWIFHDCPRRSGRYAVECEACGYQTQVTL